jgi:6,7-dimethyl-8-ribityllumazine synthase
MAEAPHILIIDAHYYEAVAAELVRGAERALKAAGASYEVVTVPGAFEIPATIAMAHVGTPHRRFDGYIALGCVIRGETTHYDYVCQESARGLQDLAVQHKLAIGYGILTVENEEQAWERGKLDRGDKGGVAAQACLAMIAMRQKFGLKS